MSFARTPTVALSAMVALRRLVMQSGVFLAILISYGTFPPVAVNAVVKYSTTSETTTDRCWIFTHLHKAGGSTVKGILRDSWCPKCGIYDSRHWKKGDRLLENIGEVITRGYEWQVIAGGYTEALRRTRCSVGEVCEWFTVFRHPISRMVSAYYYCKKSYKDQLCASKYLSANHVDLVTFAKHWGNFAMRQFALGLVSPDDVMAYSETAAAREQLPPLGNKKVNKTPGWYMLKMYLEHHAWTPENERENENEATRHDAALYDMLQPVQDLLRDKYTAVGILEEFNSTLSLFEAALDMPGVDWHRQFASSGKVKVTTKYLEEKAETLAEAWTNSEIKKYIQLDMLLYEHAVAVFHQQARAYGLR